MATVIVLCKVIALLFVLMTLVCCKKQAQPVHIKAQVTGDKVVVKWKDTATASRVPESGNVKKHHGLVLVIQEQKSSSLPQFVKMASHTEKAKIRGLKPDSFYTLKLMEYSDDDDVEDTVMTSSPITLDTKGLNVPLATNLTVEEVGSEHFKLAWHHELTQGIKDVYFTANCSEARPDSSKSKGVSLGKTGLFAHKGIVVDRDSASITFQHVKPDTMYTCAVQTRFNKSDARSTAENMVSVHTLPAKPPLPPIPKVLMDKKKNKYTKRLFIEVKPPTKKNEHISHYLVIAVPMRKGAEGTFIPVVKMKSLVSKSLTPELVSKAKVPVPFTLCNITPSDLPKNITVDFSQNVSPAAAFHSDELYSFTIVAFNGQNAQNGPGNLYTASGLSFPPIAIHRISTVTTDDDRTTVMTDDDKTTVMTDDDKTTMTTDDDKTTVTTDDDKNTVMTDDDRTTVTDDVTEAQVSHLVSILATVLSILGVLVLVAVGSLLSWLLYKRCSAGYKAYRTLPWWESESEDEEEGTVYTARPELENEVCVRKMPSLGRPSPHPSADNLLFNPAYNEEELSSMLEQMKTYQRPPTVSTTELSPPDVQEGSFPPPQTPVIPTPERPSFKRVKPRWKDVARRLKAKPVAVPPQSFRRTSSAPEMKDTPTV